MPDFIFAYHMTGEMPGSPEEGAALMARWQAWVADNSAALTNPGNPVGMSKTVSTDGVADNGGSNPLCGFSVVTADSIDEAVAVAESCPHLEIGTIEVAEMMEMPG
jgi:hypothetical protein